jgi:phosphoribosylformimino-5-aminoimidazole carboxamide ribotide isomerase
MNDLSGWFEGPIEAIPAVDVLEGAAVRLRQGNYDDVVNRADDPPALARGWREAGARRIHLVDLDGARSGQVRPELVVQVVDACAPLPVQASGGIRTEDHARALLNAGADRIVVGTAAWPDPGPWADAFGDALVVAIDVRDGRLRTRGWTQDDGPTIDDALRRASAAGVGRCLVTAIERDGTLAGPDLALAALAAGAGLRVLAAGGVRTPDDLVALADAGAEAAIVGRALWSTR